MTPVLSRVHLSPAAHRLTRDTQAMHRTLCAAADGRVMWALPTREVLIAQAAVPIDVARLPGVASESVARPRVTRWEGSVRLALIANPTRAVRPVGPERRRGAPRPLPIDECETWLRRKLADAVDIGEVRVQEMGNRGGHRHADRVVHRLVGFEALGTVTDADLLERLIVDGVGRGKAYGAGLLLVAAG